MDIGDVKSGGEAPTTVSVVTINDDIALEYRDQVLLKFQPLHDRFIEDLEKAGEFLRDEAFLDILDNDGGSPITL